MPDSAPWNNVRHKPEENCQESSPAERVLGVLIHRRLKRSQQCVPWQPGGQTSPWSAPNTERLMVQRGDYPAVSSIVGLILNAVCNSGSCHWRGMWRSLNVFCQGHQSRGRDWQECPLSSCWGHWVCEVWSEGGRGVISLFPTASRGGEVQREVLNSSPWYAVSGHMGMAKICIRQGRFMLDMGTFFLLGRWWSPGTGFLELWLMPSACQHSSECLRRRFLKPWFNFWSALKWSGIWTRRSMQKNVKV